MRIHLSRIPPSGLRQSVSLPLSGLPRLRQQLPAEAIAGAVGPAAHELRAQVLLKNRSGLVQVTGELTADVPTPCHRCPQVAIMPVAGPVELTLVPSSQLGAAHEEVRLNPSDLDISFYEGEEVDLAAMLEDELLLLCPETCCEEDEQGRCQVCGKTEQEVLGAESARDAAPAVQHHPFAAMKALLQNRQEGPQGNELHAQLTPGAPKPARRPKASRHK